MFQGYRLDLFDLEISYNFPPVSAMEISTFTILRFICLTIDGAE